MIDGEPASHSMTSALEREGRIWFRGALSASELSVLDVACATHGAPGARLELRLEIAQALSRVTQLARELAVGAKPVRLVAFDKSAETNWGLPWHQDRVVALDDGVEVPGFSNWTRKAGVWHAEPPPGVMESMIFVRVHLDPADEANGCLELALGSHRAGRIPERDVEQVVVSAVHEACVAARGDVLFAKALILHRSKPSLSGAGRRALRIDYSAAKLPAPAKWAVAD
jgi:ectoine hydroxylase-related dioxygenase (phytanoyl-CoA dioxygenase family)